MNLQAGMLVTYHYLVRSTFIGWVLNGRRYSFKPIFGARTSSDPGPDLPTEVRTQD